MLAVATGCGTTRGTSLAVIVQTGVTCPTTRNFSQEFTTELLSFLLPVLAANREWNPRVIERTSDTCISRGSRDGGVSARDNKSPRTPPQDLPRVTEVRDSGFSQGSRDSGVSQGSRDSGVSARDIEIPGSPPQDLSRDSGVSQGARDNIFLVSNKEKSLKTEVSTTLSF